MLNLRAFAERFRLVSAQPSACPACGEAMGWSEEIPLDFFMPLQGNAYSETRWYRQWCCPRSSSHPVYATWHTRTTEDGPQDR